MELQKIDKTIERRFLVEVHSQEGEYFLPLSKSNDSIEGPLSRKFLNIKSFQEKRGSFLTLKPKSFCSCNGDSINTCHHVFTTV